MRTDIAKPTPWRRLTLKKAKFMATKTHPLPNKLNALVVEHGWDAVIVALYDIAQRQLGRSPLVTRLHNLVKWREGR